MLKVASNAVFCPVHVWYTYMLLLFVHFLCFKRKDTLLDTEHLCAMFLINFEKVDEFS